MIRHFRNPIGWYVLIGGIFLSSLQAIERDLFVFQNGVHFSTSAERIAVLKALGYDGIGSARPGDLANRVEAYSAADLSFFSVYVGAKLQGEGMTVPEQIVKSIAELKGSGTVIELFVQGSKKANTDDEAVAFVRKVAALAEESQLKVVLYPHSNFYIDKLSDAVRIANKADRKNVGVMFNLCHFLKVEPTSDLASELKAAGDLLWRVSLSGASKGGKQWSELIQPLGKGDYDVRAVLDLLDQVGYKGPVGLQCYGIKGDCRVNLKQSISAWVDFHSAVK